MWRLTFAEQKISLCLVPPPHGALHSPEGPVVQAYPPEEPECSIIYVKKYCKNLSFEKLKKLISLGLDVCGWPDGVSFIASFFMEYSNSTPGFSSWYNTYEFIVINWKKRRWSLLNVVEWQWSWCWPQWKGPLLLVQEPGYSLGQRGWGDLAPLNSCTFSRSGKLFLWNVHCTTSTDSSLEWLTCSLKLLWVVYSPVAVEVVVPTLVSQGQVVIWSLHLVLQGV